MTNIYKKISPNIYKDFRPNIYKDFRPNIYKTFAPIFTQLYPKERQSEGVSNNNKNNNNNSNNNNNNNSNNNSNNNNIRSEPSVPGAHSAVLPRCSLLRFWWEISQVHPMYPSCSINPI